MPKTRLPFSSSFVSDGAVIAASLFTDPPVFFGGEVVSPTRAELRGWFRQEDLSDFQPLAGSLQLVGSGRTLVIAPDTVPFDFEGCDFVAYRGGFSEAVTDSP